MSGLALGVALVAGIAGGCGSDTPTAAAPGETPSTTVQADRGAGGSSAPSGAIVVGGGGAPFRDLAPGTFTARAFRPALSASVGPGWSLQRPEHSGNLQLVRGASELTPENLPARLTQLGFFTPTAVLDPVSREPGAPPGDLVAWLRGHPGVVVESAGPATVGGSP